MLVAGRVAGSAGAGLDAGVPRAGVGLFGGGTILRVSCRAVCAGEFVTARTRIEAEQQIARTLFIGEQNVPQPAPVGKGKAGPVQACVARRFR